MGWGITGQSSPDWVKMTSSRTSKPNNSGLSKLWRMKIGRKWSDKTVPPVYLFKITKIDILHFFESWRGEKGVPQYLHPTVHFFTLAIKFVILATSQIIISILEPVVYPFFSSTAYFVIAWAVLKFLEPLLDNYKGKGY